MRKFWKWVAGNTLLILCLSLILPAAVAAGGPEDTRQVKGILSDMLACLAIDRQSQSQASGRVNLHWQGEARQARLVLSIAGPEAPHLVKVNGRPVGQVPVYAGGEPCGEEETIYLDVPIDVVVQGENLIEITDSGLAGDAWTAAKVRLIVLGDLTLTLPHPQGQPGATGLTAGPTVFQATFTNTFTFTNTYDGTTQDFVGQIPAGYDGTPTPLLVAAHPRGGTMEFGVDTFGPAADSRTWLLASPQMHGRWTPPPAPPGKYAYASLESQYDLIGTVNYMVEHYNVDPHRIYLVGYSMGGQGAVVTAAKFPHLFAAVFDNKGPTDMAAWYAEQVAYYKEGQNKNHVVAMREECYVVVGGTNTPAYPSTDFGTPTNPFCYQRRSGLNFASNYIHVPISITHSISDALVPITHSLLLRDAINSYDPDQTASVFEEPDAEDCPSPSYHCYEPAPDAVLDFLAPYTLNNNPDHINITTDESKSYYWLNISQTGGDHWSQVEVGYDLANKTVTATISDTKPLTLGFNLGSASLPSTYVIPSLLQPGMGLPDTTYLVKGGSLNYLVNYTATSGYLTTTLASTGQFSLTISGVKVSLTADPALIPRGQAATSTISILSQDQLGNPVPDGTPIQLSTSEGVFSGGGATYTASTTAGQATAILNLGPDADLALIVATLGAVSDTTTVDMSSRIFLPVVVKN